MEKYWEYKAESRDRQNNKDEESKQAILEKERKYKAESRNRQKKKGEEAKRAILDQNRKYKAASRERKRTEGEASKKALLDQHKKHVALYRRRKIATSVANTRRSKFSQAIIFGPIFICSCCSRRLYESGVVKISEKFKEKVNGKKHLFYNVCIKEEIPIDIKFNGNQEKSGSYICHTCKLAMESGKMPAMAVQNGLGLVPLENDDYLTELENNLIAQNINFQYIYCLPKSRWGATKKQMISVPVQTSAIINTMTKLPRLPKDAGLIHVKLKRKKVYQGCHRKELIDPQKVFRILKKLRNLGHPYYQFFSDFNSYEKRCRKEDEEGYNTLFTEEDFSSSCKEQQEVKIDETEDLEDLESNYVLNDPIRKHQFDPNTNTCLTSNYPEIFVNENGKKQDQVQNKELEFAPAEGNTPINLLNEQDWDIKSWPSFHPDGKFGIHHRRKVKITDQQYFTQRILNKDERFSRSPGYIFNTASYLEQKQLSSKVNISFMRGQKTSQNGIAEYELDDAFSVFDGIRNTPKYWQKVKYDMIAKLENFGPFHIFFTLSCGDKRYDENFSSVLRDKGYSLEYLITEDGHMKTFVFSRDGRKLQLDEFLQTELDDSIHEIIRTNVLTATRNFHNRLIAFRNEVIMGKNNPMKVKYITYRIEFQARGAAHAHGTLWLDLKTIEGQDQFDSKILSDAFHKLRHNERLTEDDKDAIAKLTDIFITCSTNPSLVTQETVDIVKEVNCHCCTSKCASACKYGFPRFPLKDTIMIDKNEPKNSTVEDKEKILNRENILRKVREVLKDDDKLETIFKKYPEKGETLEDDYYFRSQRIEELLKVAGDISYEDYVISLKCMKNNGSTVLIRRDIDEIYVNNYNQEWITNWNANMDIQIVLDYFGLITYVTDYWAKADEGLTPILREAAKQLKAEPEQKKRAQEMANTFISHRQMGEAEAYYKILPNLTLKYSNVDTVFVPTDKKELRSRFLMKIDDTHENFLLGTTVKGGREGRFLEKRDIIDKYCRRDLDLNEHLKNLCLSQFAKMYGTNKFYKN